MNKKAQWILTEKQLSDLQKYRQEYYRKFDYPIVNHGDFSRGYLYDFLKFVRERKKKHPAEYPFKFQKVIYYTVALFKRYYLLNSYVIQDISYTQVIICAIYLSLKYNEYDENIMFKMANKWKSKPFFNFMNLRSHDFQHYGDQGYTDEELRFLSSIKFQTGLSKLITPIEAMYHIVIKGRHVKQELPNHSQKYQDPQELRQIIFDILTLLYGHPTLTFLYQGPKLALSIMYQALRQKGISYQKLGEDFAKLIEQNFVEIEHIIQMLEEEKKIDVHQRYEFQKAKILRNMRTFLRPMSKTPKLQPRHDTYPEQE